MGPPEKPGNERENNMKQSANLFKLSMTILLLALWGCSTLHKSDLRALQGTWTGHEPGVTPEAPRQIVFKGDRLEYRGAVSNDWGNGTFTLREELQPKQLVVVVTDCGIPQYLGKTSCLIYKIEKGTLTIAVTEPGNTVAPANFETENARHMEFTKK